MNIDDLILVSIDDHLLEPPGMFDRHMPAAYQDRTPRLVRVNGTDAWSFEGRRYPLIGLNAVVGRPREEYGTEALNYDQMRPGCYEVAARVDDMNVNGVLAGMCFPTFPGFGGTTFLQVADKAVALAAVRAYNDWHVHEWCGAAPGRFIPLGILPLWDIALVVQEVERLVKLGVHAVTFPDNPSLHKLPSIHSDHWDPFWKVCADNRVVINCHIGTGYQPPHASEDSPVDAWITAMPMAIANSAADWTFAPMWRKFPALKMALSEGGIGWIPYLLERADFTYEHHHAWTHSNFDSGRPSEVFKRHIITCFIDDRFGLKNRGDIGLDMITWECDYPHSDCTWPQTPEILARSLEGLPQADIDKVTHLNAMREYSFDPFSILGRGNCTVRALRARAAHVDTAPTLGLGGIAMRERPGQVTSGDFKRQMERQFAGLQG
ncbi:MAG: amidohydrolase family protein [Gammaproteobacteria bacterium]